MSVTEYIMGKEEEYGNALDFPLHFSANLKQLLKNKNLLIIKKKEWSIGTCYNMDEFGTHYLRKKGQIQKNPYLLWFHFNETPSIGKFLQTESTLVVARGWGDGKMGSDYLIAMEFSFGVMKIFWSWMPMLVTQFYESINTTELYTLHWLKWWILCFVYFIVEKIYELNKVNV